MYPKKIKIKIIEKEAVVGRITKVFIPKSKNFPISFCQKNNKNLSKKNLWQGESQKSYTLINFSCSAQCFKQLHRL
jgi:type I restriction-modification system DNA methylase subunit